MRDQGYELKSKAAFTMYEFVSVSENKEDGSKREIRKLVKYTEILNSGIYNLGFGDKLGKTYRIDDKIVSNNGDMAKVLATVASTVYTFTDKYPDAFIIAKGSTPSRTRLYRIGISNALNEITKEFNIFGYLGGHWHEFEKNQDYTAFLIKRK